MVKTIIANDLVKVIHDDLNLYSKQVTENIKKANDECTKEFVKDTKRDAPRGRRKKKKYYTHITSSTILDTPNEKINVWHVKNPEYRLTHLLKNGHATMNGGRTKSQDFITKNYDKLSKNFEKKVEEAIKHEN